MGYRGNSHLMKIEQATFLTDQGWTVVAGGLQGEAAQVVLVFGDRHALEAGHGLAALSSRYPRARIVAASASGEIAGTSVTEDRLVATAVGFTKTRVECASVAVTCNQESYAAGRDLAKKLTKPGLVAVFIVSDGGLVNGTELARGFNENLPEGVSLSGGLAGDGTRFERTVVGLDGPPVKGQIVAIGFYGSALRVSFGSAGGWEPFGPVRTVSRADHNTLFELDGQSALALYKRYLGDQAEHLPGSALRFPLELIRAGADNAVVRTILSIDEQAGTMTFAGDIPTGAKVRFMRASYEELIDGASRAAEQTRGDAAPELVLCVSCVGRRIVLGQRTEEETESVRAVVGDGPVIAGFYSYGELAPGGTSVACQLHNQTMTITALREA